MYVYSCVSVSCLRERMHLRVTILLRFFLFCFYYFNFLFRYALARVYIEMIEYDMFKEYDSFLSVYLFCLPIEFL